MSIVINYTRTVRTESPVNLSARIIFNDVQKGFFRVSVQNQR